MKPMNPIKTMNANTDKDASNAKTLEENASLSNNTYVTFFEQAPVALWVEDFSKAKLYIEKVASENNTDVKSFVTKNPKFIKKLIDLIEIKDINDAALKLYKAKSKQELLQNLKLVFTQKSYRGFAKLITDILLGGTVTEIETVNKTLNGEEFDALVKYKVSAGSEITLENVIVSIENITDSVKSRKAVIESEYRYKEAQSLAKIGSWFHNFDTDESHWSDEAYKILGLVARKDFLNIEVFIGFVHPDDREFTMDYSYESFLKNPIQHLQYRIITANGELKYISEVRRAIIENQKIVKIIGIGQDISERVLNEQKLNTTKSFLSNTLSSIKDGLVILDRDSKYIYVNQKAADLLGKNVEALIGKHIWTEFPEKEGDLFYDNYQKAIKTQKPISFENYFEPWNKWFENRIIPSQEGILMFFHETTDKKETENKIKVAYNIINKSSSVAFLCENKHDFPIVFTSENSHNLFGYTHQEILAGTVKLYQLVYKDDREWVSKEFIKFLKNKKSHELKLPPFRIFTKKGDIKWIRTNLDLVRNNTDEITHIQGISEDITEHKKADDLFFESNQRLKDQFNHTPLGSIIWDLDFNISEWNNSAQRIFGYSAEEAKEKNIKDLIIPNYLEPEMKEIRVKMLNHSGHKVTNENITKSGKIITCDWYNVALKDAEGKVVGIASLVDDITERMNSKKLLENSERKYRDIFEKAIDAVLILKDGFFADCNDAALKMFGLDKATLFSIHPSKISPENQPDGASSFLKAEEMLKIALEKGSNRYRCNQKHLNGHVFPTEVTLTRINEDAEGHTVHVVISEITERVKKEALENVLYNISKAALTTGDFKEFSLFVRNELHKIIDTSNFYIAIYNEETDMINTPVFMDDVEMVEEFSAKNSLTGYVIKSKKPLIVNKAAHQELIKNNKVELIGEHAKIWVGVPLIIQEKCIGAIVVQSYVDENAYNENDVQLLEFVADQISTTIQRKKVENELNIALIQAQESDRLKSAFLANMSHEIRTPMNGIIGFSELCLDPNISKEKQREFANIVIKSSKRLLSIVNDILDISKIEAGAVTLNLENVNLNRLLDELEDFYKPIAQENNLVLTCERGLENYKSCVETDKVKLNQVLTNLLSNAFKFTDNGSVSFGYQLIENNLQFYVKDTGIGVDDNLQTKIFDRFSQGNLNLSKQHKGTGLGLAITKKIVELFNGEIWLNSNENGTTIYFTIPYVKSKTPLISSVIEEQKPSIQVKNKEITILVAEDEEYNMMYITELFSSTNFKIIEANNGKKALELAQSNPDIQLVLMDIKMPVMDGNEAMKEIKKLRPSLPVIALSAFAMESDKVRAMGLGFDAYLTKPLDRKLLFQLIEKFSKKEE
ncbi:MAG TPA: PAS domain S-box protein [Lutibacter sp.]|nr:PAS domain S-box protein [Lutibacter sp.]